MKFEVCRHMYMHVGGVPACRLFPVFIQLFLVLCKMFGCKSDNTSTSAVLNIILK
jgi:hypothetical protein